MRLCLRWRRKVGALVSNTPDSQHIAWAPRVALNFGAQAVNMRIDRVFIAFMAVSPHQIQQLRTGIDPAWMLHKLEQQVELLASQAHRLPIECDLALRDFDHEVARPDGLLSPRGNLCP